jgi:hypothetical protein
MTSKRTLLTRKNFSISLTSNTISGLNLQLKIFGKLSETIP